MNELKVTGIVLPISEATRKRNPDLFGRAVVRPDPAKPKPYQRSEVKDSGMEEVPKRFYYGITIISMRKRLVDEHDNLRTAAKPLVDAITEWLGFRSDNDPQLRWDYHQMLTSGNPGTIVKIEART